MRARMSLTALGFALALSYTPAAAEEVLYVSTVDGHVAVIDTQHNEMTELIETGGRGDDVAGSPDGRTVYANLWIIEGHRYQMPTAGQLVAIDTATHEIKWRMPLTDGWPHHITVSADGNYLFSPVFDRSHINVIDLNTQTIVRRIDGVLGMHGTKLSPDGSALYVGAMTMEAFAVFDIASGDITNIMDFVGGVRPFAVSHDGTTLYTQLSRLHGFAVADLTRNEVEQTIRYPIPEGVEPPASWPHSYNHGLEITPDGETLVVAASLGDFVAIYDLPSLTERARVPICDAANWVVTTADSSRAYVSCEGDDQVTVIDLEQGREIKRIDLPGADGPVRMRLVDVPAAD
ncbi:MAG: YncE family protein [Hyphomonadaceae bacterium]|nr:YncE family protein [Hyphomonadaceae bacterium]